MEKSTSTVESWSQTRKPVNKQVSILWIWYSWWGPSEEEAIDIIYSFWVSNVTRDEFVREHFNKAERTISCPVNKPFMLFILISILNCLESGVHWQPDANGTAAGNRDSDRTAKVTSRKQKFKIPKQEIGLLSYRLQYSNSKPMVLKTLPNLVS